MSDIAADRQTILRGARDRLAGFARAFFRTPLVAAINIAALALIALAVPPIVDWAILDAVWTGATGAACPPDAGACWTFIAHKYRLILFGRYPFDEQWRPLAATVLLLAMTGASCWPTFWTRRLLAAWPVALALYALLMWGGVLGLSFNPTTYWGGLPLTVLLSVLGIVIGFVVSVPVALGRRSRMPVIRVFCTAYIELVRGVPLISILFLASVVLPLFLPDGFTPSGLVRVLAGIVFFFAAYMAEVLRGGLQAIPRGQYEAASSLGLGYMATMWKVILPQTFELVLPAMVNLFIGAIKGTSLVVIIAMMDLLGAAQAALADPNWIGFYVEAYVFAGAIYVLLCSAVSWYGRKTERRLRTMRGR